MLKQNFDFLTKKNFCKISDDDCPKIRWAKSSRRQKEDSKRNDRIGNQFASIRGWG